jgi:hypothetical protein
MDFRIKNQKRTKLNTFLIVILILVTFQMLTYHIIGKETLTYQYFNKIENYNLYNGTIGVFDNKFSEKQKTEIEKRLLKRYKSVNFISDKQLYYDKYRVNDNLFGLSIEIKYSFPYLAYVEEEHGILYYGET